MWARQDLNLQPTDYESAALTGLSYGPEILRYYLALFRALRGGRSMGTSLTLPGKQVYTGPYTPRPSIPLIL
jgi:hypothetical protein